MTLNLAEQLAVKGAFLFGLTAVNIFGVRAAGRINDALTFIKLSPLLVLVAVGLSSLAMSPSGFASNYSPLAPNGFGNIGTSIVLIFWAYVGFEMGTLPADEVRDPSKTIPRAIITGMAVVLFFYVSTNFIIFGAVSSTSLAQTAVPLVLVGATLIPLLGGGMMSVGALFSVSGSDESGILGTARLSYALSIDGLFPKVFAKVHPKYRTPYASLLIQGAIAFVLSVFSGLSNLISFSVLNLSFCFLLVSIAFVRISRKGQGSLRGQRALPWLGIAVCLFLLYSTSLQDKLVGSVVVLAGIPLYAYFSPKVDMADLKNEFLAAPQITRRYLEKTDRFLGRLVKLMRRIV